MDASVLESKLQKLEAKGINFLYNNGFQWIKKNFIPYLELAELVLENKNELIADCWYLLGDIYDFNTAPNKAINCYKAAIEYDENIDGAYREIAYLSKIKGEYKTAQKWISKALEIAPDNIENIDLKAEIIDCINYNTEPYLTAENKLWHLREMLANEAFEKVIEQVSNIDSDDESFLQVKAMAYGALDMHVEYIECWKEIEKIGANIIVDYPDWFYMPIELRKSHFLWKIFSNLSPRIHSFELMDDEWITEYENEYSVEELFKDYCLLNIAKLKKDEEEILKFQKKYPAKS